MNELQKTKLWGEFVTWFQSIYMKNYYNDITLLYNGESLDYHIKGWKHDSDYFVMFIDLPFEFQKGVFETFLKSKGYLILQVIPDGFDIRYKIYAKESNEFPFYYISFEEMLIDFFIKLSSK
jgi:hypothetical protein